jgi:hypothetical protein
LNYRPESIIPERIKRLLRGVCKYFLAKKNEITVFKCRYLSKWLQLARKSSKKLLAFPLGNSEKKRVVRFPRGENVNDLDLKFKKRKDCYL